MTERVKVYEENSSTGLPLLAWLLPLLVLLAAAAFYFLHVRAATPRASAAATAGALPDLGTVHFESGKAILTADDRATLDRAADSLEANPRAHLRIEGFTDSTGDAPLNQTLSQQRAASVAEYLRSKGISGGRLTGGGFSASDPVDTNATDAGKADNRRVELFSQE